jgi:hypothetical protein
MLDRVKISFNFVVLGNVMGGKDKLTLVVPSADDRLLSSV